MGFKTWMKSKVHSFGGEKKFEAQRIKFSKIKKNMLFTLKPFTEYKSMVYDRTLRFQMFAPDPELNVFRKESENEFSQGFIMWSYSDLYTPVKFYTLKEDFELYIYELAPYNYLGADLKSFTSGQTTYYLKSDALKEGCRYVTWGISFELPESTNSRTKKCPYCAEEIKSEAIVCRYCNRDL